VTGVLGSSRPVADCWSLSGMMTILVRIRLDYRPREQRSLTWSDTRRRSGGNLNWSTAICLGAAGGAIVSVVAFCADVFSWQQTRQAAHETQAGELPTLRKQVDPWPDFVVLITRVVLGVLAVSVFRFQVTTPLAAFTVGASGPGLLAQLGNARQAKAKSEGTDRPHDASKQLVEATEEG
jgi:hypothetical protein